MPCSESTAGLAAVLFDMDGVITDTARAHAAAWQQLFDAYLEQHHPDQPPFDPARDYRRHVDGKPRLDGIRSFLAARGIELAEGSEQDGPDARTVHGLGQRKNGYFTAWLEAHRVRAYPDALALLERLRSSGMRLAVFSASRNATAVLESAGVLEAFDIKLDGEDAAALDLPGKPDPAILLEAARRLGVAPARAAVVEDAIAGIEAAIAGGFAQSIGVDRHGSGRALQQAGAGLVVADLEALALDDHRRLSLQPARHRPEPK